MRAILSCAAIAGVLAVGAHGATGASHAYADPVGDAVCCNDIGAVAISNDQAGMVTIHIEMPSDPAPGAGRPVMIWLNTDGDRATGGGIGLPELQLFRRFGSDYRIVLDTAGDPRGVLQLLSTGRPLIIGAVDAAYDRGWTVRFDRRAIGGGSTFEFFVSALDIQPGAAIVWTDDAPDAALGVWGWSYDLGLPPLVTRPTLTASRTVLAPSPPRAGRRLVAKLPFQLTSREAVRLRLLCSASVGGRALRSSRAGDFLRNLDDGVAVCAWEVPRAARGRLVRGTLILTAGSATIVRRFAARVR